MTSADCDSTFTKLIENLLVQSGTQISRQDSGLRTELAQFPEGAYKMYQDQSSLPTHLAQGIIPCVKHKHDTHDMWVKFIHDNYRPSKNVNMGIIYYILDNNDLHHKYRQRILFVFEKYMQYVSGIQYNSPFLVGGLWSFHGTTAAFDVDKNNTFQTLAFLSTTLDLSIAESYSKSRGLGHIYVIYIPGDFPFVNLHAKGHKYSNSKSELLLPFGTKIQVKHEQRQDKRVYHFCMILSSDNAELLDTMKHVKEGIEFSQVLPDVQDITEYHTLTIDGKKLYIQQTLKGSAYLFTDTKSIADSTEVYKTLFKQNTPWAFMTDYQVLLHAINEMMAADIYREVFGLATLDYELQRASFSSDTFVLKSEYQKNLSNVTDDTLLLEGYIADCVMINWDIYNNNNCQMLEGQQGQPVVCRVDVGGCMRYRGKGDINHQWRIATNPMEHIQFLQEQPKLRVALKSNMEQLDTILYRKLDTLNLNELVAIQKNYNDIATENAKLSTTITTDHTNRIKHMIETNCDIVRQRCEFYMKNKGMIIKSILAEINSHPLGGGSKGNFIRYAGRKYKVYINSKKMTYIVVKKRRVYLKSIRSKYRYLSRQPVQTMVGGSPDCPCDEIGMDVPSIAVTPDSFKELMTDITCRLTQAKAAQQAVVRPVASLPNKEMGLGTAACGAGKKSANKKKK